MKKYLDVNIFLNAVLYDDDKGKKCKDIISMMVNKKFIGVTSALTWDEVVYVISKNLGREIAKKEGEKFLQLENLHFVDANKNIIIKSQILINHYNIKPRDAIHAASAILNNIQEIISDDDDFDKVEEIKRIGPEEF